MAGPKFRSTITTCEYSTAAENCRYTHEPPPRTSATSTPTGPAEGKHLPRTKRHPCPETAHVTVSGLRAELSGDDEAIDYLLDSVRSLLCSTHAPAPVVPDSVPVEVRAKLGVYVYALVDPRTSEVFYVGKGRGNRVYQHVQAAIADVQPDRSEMLGPADSTETRSAKDARIRAIFQDGFGVEHWIVRHAIGGQVTSDGQAFAIEQAMIDLAAISGTALTNIQGGHVSTDFGLRRAEELVTLYSADPVPELPDDCALIKVNAASRPDATPEEIYAWARGDWRAGAVRNVTDLPVLVFDGAHRNSPVMLI